MTRTVNIDFVADLVCPWCAVALFGLEQALERMQGQIDAKVTMRAFELNPDMAPEGEVQAEHIAARYRGTPEEAARSKAELAARATAAGLTLRDDPAARIWNTFDAHRLVAWARDTAPDRQGDLTRALFTAHFTDGRNISDRAVLAEVAGAAGLDAKAAATVLAGDAYAEAVRADEAHWKAQGLNGVPAIVVEGRYMIRGGQTVEVIEDGLKRILARL